MISALNIVHKLNSLDSISKKFNLKLSIKGESMNVIETKDISYSYPDGTLALKDVEFNAAKGKIIALSRT